MPSISLKKIVVALLAIIALSRLDKIVTACAGVYQFFCESLEPWHELPVQGRFAIAIAILVLLYVSVFTLLQNRNRK
jgi:hypothetical protein